MTQFQPPPDAPGIGHPDHYAPPVGSSPPRWSAAAVSAFVLSLLGCTGIGAVLGLILGPVGIVAARGGHRRGFGLAVAAIPISLVTGVMAVFIGWLAYTSVRLVMDTPRQLSAIMGTEVVDASEAWEALRDLASDEFRAEVSAETAQAWLATVWETHGRLVDVQPDEATRGGSTPDGDPFMNFDSRFVNGRANVRIVFDARSVWTAPKIVDIEVDGVSPRDSD